MNVKTIVAALASCALLSSCYCDKLTVGNVNPSDELVHVKSVRNAHVLGGLIVTHDKAADQIQGVNDYVVESKMTLGDLIVGAITCGIYTPTTTKYYVSKNNPNVVVEKKKWNSKAYKGHLK